jgi:hypothetical protein
MFSPLRFLSCLLLGLGLLWAKPANASHAIGGSLTYTSLGNNRYVVTADFFRDCSGIVAPPSFTLTCTSACGVAGTSTILNQVGQPFIGTPYSSAIQPLAVCPLTASAPASAPTNFAAYRYSATVTLAPSRWILSVEENARPMIANASAGTLRLEATLDNRTMTNNSVAYSNLPVMFIPHLQPNLLQVGAFDVDGDSLSYELAKPLNGCGTYETYLAYPAQCQSGVISTSPPCLLNCTLPAFYSARLPIAVKVDTVGTCPNKTTAPRFAFDSLSGAFAFTPNRYLNTVSSQGDNKYIVPVKVTEWRRVNGTYVVVGTTRRDMAWIVYDGSNATQPRLTPSVQVQDGLQTRTQALTAPIAVLAGEPISVNFSANTSGTTPLEFTLEQNTVPGAVMQAGAISGTARLTFTPPLSLPNGTYRVSVTVKDDATPLRNIITVPITFRVYRGALATRSGSAQVIAAYPTPFTTGVQFQLPTAGTQALTVFDQLGRVVAHLSSLPNGKVQWNPGPEVPAGLYSARSADGRLAVRLLRSAAQ